VTRPDRIRVLAVDDHPLIREGIAALLANQADITLVAEAADGDAALQQCRAHRPHLVLIDLQMPGLSGIDAISAIRGEFPAVRIIVLTTYGGDDLARRALSAGAHAYILKSTVRRDLLETIRAVHRGQKRIQPEVADGVALHASNDPLTPREITVLQLISAGKSNKVIAADLVIAEVTVKGNVKKILAKLQASDRTHAVSLGLKRGIIELE
jgi:DNA-binding NarL/FixJ family response regulator